MADQVFCAKADLEARFTTERVAEVFSVQAADGSTGGVADAGAVDVACADASAFVAQYLLGVHLSQMPFGTIPAAVKLHACNVAMYFGMRRRPEYHGKKPDEVPYAGEFAEAKASLKLIREGLLRVAADLAPANAGGTIAQQTAPELSPAGTFITDPSTGRGGFEPGTF